MVARPDDNESSDFRRLQAEAVSPWSLFRPMIDEQFEMLNGRSRADHVFGIARQLAHLGVVFAGIALDGVERVPAGADLERRGLLAGSPWLTFLCRTPSARARARSLATVTWII
jgi:hypothetical protein